MGSERQEDALTDRQGKDNGKKKETVEKGKSPGDKETNSLAERHLING